jgi:DNA-binding CsgD family transcriptional regulator
MKDLLSKSEKEVVLLSAQDKSACEIAAILNKSTFTVQKQLDDAKKKLGCNTIQGLTAKAILLNLIFLITLLIHLFFMLKHQHSAVSQMPDLITTIEETNTL